MESVLDTIVIGSASPPERNFALSTFITVPVVSVDAVSLLQDASKIIVNWIKIILNVIFNIF